MDNQEKFQETQDEAVSREAREDRDACAREILRDMSDYLSRFSVEFPLPWTVDSLEQEKEKNEDKEVKPK